MCVCLRVCVRGCVHVQDKLVHFSKYSLRCEEICCYKECQYKTLYYQSYKQIYYSKQVLHQLIINMYVFLLLVEKIKTNLHSGHPFNLHTKT